MISVFDAETHQLATTVESIWAEIRVRKDGWIQRRDGFDTFSIILDGHDPLLICAGVEELQSLRNDYCPIFLKRVNRADFETDDWFTLASKGGTSEFEQSIQWLFEPLSLRLLAKQEWVEKTEEGVTRRFDYEFYGGVELSNPLAGKSLRIEADDLGVYVVHATFVG